MIAAAGNGCSNASCNPGRRHTSLHTRVMVPGCFAAELRGHQPMKTLLRSGISETTRLADAVPWRALLVPVEAVAARDPASPRPSARRTSPETWTGGQNVVAAPGDDNQQLCDH